MRATHRGSSFLLGCAVPRMLVVMLSTYSTYLISFWVIKWQESVSKLHYRLLPLVIWWKLFCCTLFTYSHTLCAKCKFLSTIVIFSTYDTMKYYSDKRFGQGGEEITLEVPPPLHTPSHGGTKNIRILTILLQCHQ